MHLFDGSGFKFRHQHSVAREHAHAISDLASDLDGRRSSSAACAEDGALLVGADDAGTIVVWRVDSCREVAVQASAQVTTLLPSYLLVHAASDPSRLVPCLSKVESSYFAPTSLYV